MATLTNATDIDFPPTTAGGEDITHIFIADAVTAGAILWRRAITINRSALTIGQFYRIGAGEIDMATASGGDSTESGKQRELAGLIDGTVYVGLDESGTELSGGGYARQGIASVAGWTIT